MVSVCSVLIESRPEHGHWSNPTQSGSTSCQPLGPWPRRHQASTRATILGTRKEKSHYPPSRAKTHFCMRMRGGSRNSRFQTRTACMLVLDIDYRPQCGAHAHQVRDFHSMVGRGARTRTFRVKNRSVSEYDSK